MDIAPPQSLAEVASLIKRLYQPGNATVIVKIQDQLQLLQRSAEGWQLADALLANDDINVRFFGALTFTVKLNNDGSSLDEATSRLVLQRLISWFVRLVNAREKPMVVRKLCSTLVTYFTRVPLKWERPLLHLICSFRQGDAVPVDELETVQATPEDLLQGFSTRQQIALLWLSAALADEISKMEYSGPKQASLHAQMEAEIRDATPLMRHAMAGQAVADDDESSITAARIEAMHCFSTWASYAQPMWPTKPEALSFLQGLLPDAMGLLMLDSCENEAMNVFIDLLESYTSFFDAPNLDRLAQYIGEVQGPRLREHLEQDGAAFHQAGPFVIAYGIAVIEDVIQQPESPRTQSSLPLLLAILRASGYPGDDDELSVASIEFWNTYTETVTDLCFSEDINELKTPWVAHARSVAFEAVDLIWRKLWTPPGAITKDWGDTEREGFSTFRADATDLFSSMYVFLREDMLTRLVSLAVQAVEQKEWRGLEAAMYSLNAIADNVLEEFSSDKHIARLFSSGLYHEMGDFSQRIPVQARKTAIDMLGNYGAYLERHAEALPDAVRFLFASLGTASFATTSAKSIAALCSTCRHSLTRELDGFLAQYQNYLSSPTCEPYGKEKVIGGIAAIVQALTPESAKVAPLSALLDNVEKDVTYAKQQMNGGDVEMGQVVGVSALQCLSSIGRSLQLPNDEPIKLYDDDDESTRGRPDFWQSQEGQVIQQRIVGCLSVLEVLGSDGEAIDAACQVLRTGLFETAPGPFVLPPSVTVTFFQQCTINTPQVEAVLSAVSLLIAQHSKPSAPRIDAEVTAVYTHVLTCIGALGYQPSTDPSIAQSIIELLARLFPAYASVLLSSPAETLTQLLNFTLLAIEAPDPLPKRSALEFWAKLIRVSGPPSATLPIPSAEAQQALAITTAFGPSFTLSLIRQVAGLGQRSELDYTSDPLKALFSALPAQGRVWMEAALWSEHFPAVHQGIGDEEKRRFLMQMVQLRGGSRVKEVVRDFYMGCRGLRGAYG